MITFFYTKRISTNYGRPSSFGGKEKRVDWGLLDPLLDEIWGRPSRIKWVQGFLNEEMGPGIDSSGTGINDAYLEKKESCIAISFEWAEDREFLFPKEKFKQFIDEVERTSKDVYSKSMYESPDRLKFIIDDDWNTRIEQVYLNADTSFFENNDSGMPQFRFKRVKGHQYRLVQNDCIGDPVSKTLGMLVEDIWVLSRDQGPALELLREKESGRFDYQKTYFEKNGDTVWLMRKNEVANSTLTLTADQMYRVIVLTRQFCRNLHDAPLDKLPGVIFFTFDEYWNLIPVPLFRASDKNFVDKE